VKVRASSNPAVNVDYGTNSSSASAHADLLVQRDGRWVFKTVFINAWRSQADVPWKGEVTRWGVRLLRGQCRLSCRQGIDGPDRDDASGRVPRGQPCPLIEAVELRGPARWKLLVRVVAAGVCHTDLRAHRGGVLPTRCQSYSGTRAGIVEQVDAAVSGFQAGDAVVLSGIPAALPGCRRNLPAYAIRGFADLRRPARGWQLASPAASAELSSSFFGQSSFAQYAIVEAALSRSRGDTRASGPFRLRRHHRRGTYCGPCA
jgi:hypothetical protein